MFQQPSHLGHLHQGAGTPERQLVVEQSEWLGGRSSYASSAQLTVSRRALNVVLYEKRPVCEAAGHRRGVNQSYFLPRYSEMSNIIDNGIFFVQVVGILNNVF